MGRWELKAGLLVVGLVVVASAVVLTGCPRPPTDVEEVIPPEPEPTAPTGEPYKVGAIFDLSGGASDLGKPERDTVKMIEEQVNAEGGINGRPLEVIVRDTKGEPEPAVKAVKELVETENVLALVGPSRSGTTMGIIEAVQEAEVPLISCAAAVGITTPVKEWVFKTPQTDEHAVEAIYKYCNEQGISKVAAMTVQNPFGEGGLEQIKGQAEGAGIEVVVAEEFAGTDTDMTAQLTKIKDSEAEAVICWAVGKPPVLITKQMKQLQMEIPLIQSHGVANMSYIEGSGEAANGVVLPAGRLIVAEQLPDDDPQKETVLAYARDFTAKYPDQTPNTFGGHAWDALQLVVKALKEGAEDRAAIREAIENTTNFAGIGGVFNYSATDHYGLTADALVMVKIEDGQWKLITE
jgi:branched-chain amino acid transport system substrate-binding protein